MSRLVKFLLILGVIGVSASVGASPTQTPSAEGQVMSVVAVDTATLTVADRIALPARN